MTQAIVELLAKDLDGNGGVHCPNPTADMKLWNGHPRVYLDVARTGARFANRPLGSGTRVLLEDLLAQEGLTGQHIAGFERDETSHTAVAQAVVSGAADTGLGIEMAARARGLDFVPLVDERYHLACLKATLEQPATRALRELLLTRVWQDHLASSPGYSPMHSGQVLAMSNVLPWWDFTRPKRPSAHRKKP